MNVSLIPYTIYHIYNYILMICTLGLLFIIEESSLITAGIKKAIFEWYNKPQNHALFVCCLAIGFEYNGMIK